MHFKNKHVDFNVSYPTNNCYIDNRGFMTANGQPDQARAARYALKEYVAGKLLFCHAPKDVDQATFHTYPARERKAIEEYKLPPNQQRALRVSLTAPC